MNLKKNLKPHKTYSVYLGDDIYSKIMFQYNVRCSIKGEKTSHTIKRSIREKSYRQFKPG